MDLSKENFNQLVALDVILSHYGTDGLQDLSDRLEKEERMVDVLKDKSTANSESFIMAMYLDARSVNADMVMLKAQVRQLESDTMTLKSDVRNLIEMLHRTKKTREMNDIELEMLSSRNGIY